MSTKCSIVYGDEFHLYTDLLEEDGVFLELRHVEFQASPERLTVKIPLHIWEFVRAFAGSDLSLSNKTDNELEQEAATKVKERLNESQNAAGSAQGLRPLHGIATMGAIDLPREEQVANYVRHLKQLRDGQRDVLKRVEALKIAQSMVDGQ